MNTSTETTSTDFTNAVDNWQETYVQQENDELSLTAAIKALKGLSTEEAFGYVVEAVMHDAMKVLEDGVKIKSAELNISTVLSGIVTNITNDLNGIKASNTNTGTPATTSNRSQWSNAALAQDLVTQCGDLSTALASPSASWVNPITGKTETKNWIDSGTLNTMTTALGAFTKLIGASDPSGQTVMNNVLNWTSNPTGKGKTTGQQNIQSLNSNLSTEDTSTGGLSQMASNVA